MSCDSRCWSSVFPFSTVCRRKYMISLDLNRPDKRAFSHRIFFFLSDYTPNYILVVHICRFKLTRCHILVESVFLTYEDESILPSES